MSSTSGRATATERLQQGFDAVYWTVLVNALWWVFAAAGGLLLGAAPATLAGAELTRRRLDGELFPVWRSFARAWKREFVKANLLLTPFLALGTVLAVDLAWFASRGPLGPGGVSVLVALGAVTTFGFLTANVYTHYEVPFRLYPVRAARWALGNLAHLLLLALMIVLIVGISAVIPGLLPFLTMGALVTVTSTLCTAFFRSNERLLADHA